MFILIIIFYFNRYKCKLMDQSPQIMRVASLPYLTVRRHVPLMSYRDFSFPGSSEIEWPTIALIVLCTSGWAVMTWLAADGGASLFLVPLLVYATTLHSSLQHEVVHGHPTKSRMINEALIFPALGLLFPYQRFRSLHLKHHNNARLTDPLDDPESFYLTRKSWSGKTRLGRTLLTANNTFAGRLILGPAISVTGLVAGDIRAIFRGEGSIIRAWALHAVAVTPVIYWLTAVCGFPLLDYLMMVAYPAMSLLMVRTFAEHRAHHRPEARSIIVQAGPVMSLLFLHNNLHAVHHQHPAAPWYRLPILYKQNRDAVLAGNGHYFCNGYGQLLRHFLLKPKEPVAHPLDRPAREMAG